jgi:hypothetical protein
VFYRIRKFVHLSWTLECLAVALIGLPLLVFCSDGENRIPWLIAIASMLFLSTRDLLDSPSMEQEIAAQKKGKLQKLSFYKKRKHDWIGNIAGASCVISASYLAWIGAYHLNPFDEFLFGALLLIAAGTVINRLQKKVPQGRKDVPKRKSKVVAHKRVTVTRSKKK